MKNANSPTQPRRIKDRDRCRKALALRRAGHSFDEIAKAIGYASVSSAHKAVVTEIARLDKLSARDAHHVLGEELARIDAMLRAIWKDATSGDLAAIDRVIKLQDRRAKYLGLDTAIKHEVSGPDKAAIRIETRDALVSRIAGLIERESANADPVIVER